MAITTLTDDFDIIAALDDEPNDTGGLTAAALKAKFDEAGNAVKTYVNSTLIPELDAVHLPYQYGEVGGQTIKEALDDATTGEIPDGSITALKLASDSIITAKILDGNVTISKLSSEVVGLIQKNLLNILRLKLQVSLAASDIDAYSDLFASASLINSASSSGYLISGGSLSVNSGLSSTHTGSDANLGYNSSYVKLAQLFTVSSIPYGPITATVQLKKVGTPTDNITMKIYSVSGGLPNTLLYTSSTTLDGSTLNSGSYTSCSFEFSDSVLSANTIYALVLERSESVSSSNYYHVDYGTDVSGQTMAIYGSSWSAFTATSYFSVVPSSASIVWSAVTPTEALTYAAVTSDTTPGTGSITWYLSDDGTNWTEITTEDTLQTVSFDSASLYLKCALTGNATVEAVAYGGY